MKHGFWRKKEVGKHYPSLAYACIKSGNTLKLIGWMDSLLLGTFQIPEHYSKQPIKKFLTSVLYWGYDSLPLPKPQDTLQCQQDSQIKK